MNFTTYQALRQVLRTQDEGDRSCPTQEGDWYATSKNTTKRFYGIKTDGLSKQRGENSNSQEMLG